jgi:hypothetical protein
VPCKQCLDVFKDNEGLRSHRVCGVKGFTLDVIQIPSQLAYILGGRIGREESEREIDIDEIKIITQGGIRVTDQDNFGIVSRPFSYLSKELHKHCFDVRKVAICFRDQSAAVLWIFQVETLHQHIKETWIIDTGRHQYKVRVLPNAIKKLPIFSFSLIKYGFESCSRTCIVDIRNGSLFIFVL